MVDEELDTHKEHLIRHASRATFPRWGRLFFSNPLIKTPLKLLYGALRYANSFLLLFF